MLKICGGFAGMGQNHIEDGGAAPARGGDLANPPLSHPRLVELASPWLSSLP